MKKKSKESLRQLEEEIKNEKKQMRKPKKDLDMKKSNNLDSSNCDGTFFPCAALYANKIY